MKWCTYDVGIEKSLEPDVLFLEQLEQECVPSLLGIDLESFQRSHDPDDLSTNLISNPDPRMCTLQHPNTYNPSFANAPSIHVFSSDGRNPKIRSIAPLTKRTVAGCNPAAREACRR
jgi:hypothetical protein